ncbi:hypothetical protein LJC46_01195 [Desulfovibrio sp. OttesenSCG-928-G15]|nr:hypothetical protein [Desulfovibrio sp. OttesenSCG-928-G15]
MDKKYPAHNAKRIQLIQVLPVISDKKVADRALEFCSGAVYHAARSGFASIRIIKIMTSGAERD